jgi:LPXTG-motif cell wall-anchored protein
VARYERHTDSHDPGTPVWVWLIYALGLIAATLLVLSVGLVAVVSMGSDDATYDVNVPAFVLWGVLVLVAAGTLVWRRRKGGG